MFQIYKLGMRPHFEYLVFKTFSTIKRRPIWTRFKKFEHCSKNLGHFRTPNWVKISLGGTTRNHLAKIIEKLKPNFKKKKFIYLYIGLFDWTRWVMFSPSMHTFLKINEHPKTYNMHEHFDF